MNKLLLLLFLIIIVIDDTGEMGIGWPTYSAREILIATVRDVRWRYYYYYYYYY